MYILIMLIALASGLICAGLVMHRNKVPKPYILLLSLMTANTIIFGAVSVAVIESGFKKFGLNTIGGVFGLMLSLFIFARLTPEYSGEYEKAYIIAMPLMYGFGKIGCWYAGCCGGRHINEENVIPVQMLEVIVFMLLFVVSMLLYKKNRFNSTLFGLICGITKIALDFLRETHENELISFNQIVCMLAIMLYLIYKENILWKTKTIIQTCKKN